MRAFAICVWVTSSMRSFHSLHCAALRHGQPGLGGRIPDIQPLQSPTRAQRAADCRDIQPRRLVQLRSQIAFSV